MFLAEAAFPCLCIIWYRISFESISFPPYRVSIPPFVHRLQTNLPIRLQGFSAIWFCNDTFLQLFRAEFYQFHNCLYGLGLAVCIHQIPFHILCSFHSWPMFCSFSSRVYVLNMACCTFLHLFASLYKNALNQLSPFIDFTLYDNFVRLAIIVTLSCTWSGSLFSHIQDDWLATWKREGHLTADILIVVKWSCCERFCVEMWPVKANN